MVVQRLDTAANTVVSLNPSVVLGPCLNKSNMNYSTAKLVRDVLVGNPSPADVPFNFVDVRDVAKGAVCVFTKSKDAVSSKRFILNATESLKLNEYVNKSHPEANGSNPAFSPVVTNVYMWLGKNVPFLRNAIGYTEFKGAHLDREGILRFVTLLMTPAEIQQTLWNHSLR
jgi:nucleoside-diphosphate-sugar epimerase